MEPHGVPSGGDWGLERLGALYFEGTEGLSVRGCQFERLDVRPHSLCLFSLQLTLVRLSSFVVLLWSNCAVCFGHSTLVTDATDRYQGNGIMLSGYNRAASIVDSHFAWTGGTAIAACEPPRYRCHLGCILLKMPAISLFDRGSD